jgi:hypothetical protein
MESNEKKDLRELAEKSAANDLPFLLEAKEKARRAYQAERTSENLRLFNLAKAAYDVEWAKVKSSDKVDVPAPDVVGNILAVEKYLVNAGWKVKKSKLYADKKRGLLKMQPDGTVLKADADTYAAANLAPADAAPDADDQETLRIKRETLAVDLATKQLIQERTLLRMKRDSGELIPRAEMDQVLVAAVTVLRSSMRQWIYTKMPELVDLTGGDPTKVELGIHFFLNDSNIFFNGFARARTFDVVDEDDEEEAEKPEVAI